MKVVECIGGPMDGWEGEIESGQREIRFPAATSQPKFLGFGEVEIETKFACHVYRICGREADYLGMTKS